MRMPDSSGDVLLNCNPTLQKKTWSNDESAHAETALACGFPKKEQL
jgi:hypothetical protein